MGVVLSKKKKKSSSRSTHSGQKSSSKQNNTSCLYRNKTNSVSTTSSFLQQPQALFDRNSVQSFSYNETMTSTATSSCRNSVACNMVENSSENAHQSNSFFLPDDWDSEEYNYNLHFALKKLFNGNVTPAVAPVLKKGAHVVQMGACSSAWILDMATHYPECQFSGFELGLEKIQNLPILANTTIEKSNVLNTGFTSISNDSVDYVHLRRVGSLVKSECWPNLFAEISRILKPDGIVRIEEMHNSPTGTVMIESFMETLKEIFDDMELDTDIALKYGNMLQTQGFQVVESKKKRIHYASDGTLSQEFVSFLLNLYEQKGPIIAPRLGLDLEDYRHRIEQICGECVKVNAYLEWYSWVGRKQKPNVNNK